MITATSSPGLFGAPSVASPSRTQMGKDEFLRLLITQLKNQDPLSPLQPHEFAAQLAQFSSVEQLTQVNQNLQQQIQDGQLNALMGKTTFGATLLGRFVAAEGDQVTIPSSGETRVRIDVGGAGGSAQLQLLDGTGHAVATRDLGKLIAGRQTLTLPVGLPPGAYHYAINIIDAKGAKVPVTTYTSGIVDGISFQQGQLMLKIGAMELSLDSLAEIENTPPSSPATGPTGSPSPAAFKTPPIGRM